MKSESSIRKSIDFFEKNIKPCSKVITKFAQWDEYENVYLISKYYGGCFSNLEQHIASPMSADKLQPSPNSDQELLKWLDENELILLARDFALDKPVNRGVGKEDHEFINDELFYKIESDEKNLLKLGVAKSWIFAGLLFEKGVKAYKPTLCSGVVMGVHKLDSYLIIN